MEKLTDRIKILSNGKYVLPYCNCLLIEDEINCLCDSSPTDEEMEHLKGININLIVNSHGHTDHNSRNHEFPNAGVLLHPVEHERVASGEAYLAAYGFNHFPSEDVRPLYLNAVKYHARPADGVLKDGQVISTGDVEFQVIHLPGHSGGHCGFFFHKEGFIFTADVNPAIKPFYAMVDSDVDDFIGSIEKIKQLEPDMLIAGHGKAINRGDINNVLAEFSDEFYRRDEEIIKRIREGKCTIKNIAEDAITFNGKFPQPKSIYYLHECIMIWKHLLHLERKGEVICQEETYSLK